MGKGNIVGVQPYISADDYISEERFVSSLESYLTEAQRNGFIGDKTVVVFPEYIGTWLAFTGLGENLNQYQTIMEMINKIVGNQKGDFTEAFHKTSQSAAEIYQNSFSRLAKKYGVTIVAGSILLSSPQLSEGKLVCKEGPLYNVSVTFLPHGSAINQLTKKIYLVPVERMFLTPGKLNDLHAAELSIGKVGVLVCADAWHPEVYERLNEEKADFIVVPSYQNENGLWDRPWSGYSTDKPGDFDEKDVGTITEGQAWKKYALSTRIKKTNVKGGINVFLKGNLWDMGADSGHSLAILGSDEVEISSDKDGLLNIWLP